MAYTRTKKLTDATYSATIAVSEAAIRSQVDGSIQECFDMLASTTAGSSGASNVGAELMDSSDTSAADVMSKLKKLQTDIKNTVLGQVPDGTIIDAKLSNEAGQIKDKVNAHLAESAINVKDYGATGDGVTDDTTAIQAAFDAATPGSGVYFPSGIYNCNLLTLSKDKIHIYGDGATIYKNVASGHCLTISGNDCSISGMIFDSDPNFARDTGATFLSVTGNNFKVINNTFKNCPNIDVWIAEANCGVVANNIFIGKGLGTTYGGDGVYIGAGSQYIDVIGNVFYNVDDDCVGIHWRSDYPTPNKHINIIGNVIYNGGSRGIVISSCTDILIADNYINTTNSGNIQIYQWERTEFSERIKITNNLLANSHGLIELNIIKDSIFENNTIYTPSQIAAIFIGNFDTLKVIGNKFFDLPGRAIIIDAGTDLTTTSNLVVSNNVIDTSVYEGIYLVPKSTVTLTNIIAENNTLINVNTSNISNYSLFIARTNNVLLANNVSTQNTGQGLISYDATCTGIIKAFNNYPCDAKTIIPLVGNIIGQASAAPTTGTYKRGDIILNSQPAASGYIGWVCVADGTPGTWKTFGTISA